MIQTIPFNSNTSTKIRSWKIPEFLLHLQEHIFDHFTAQAPRGCIVFFLDLTAGGAPKSLWNSTDSGRMDTATNTKRSTALLA